MVQTQWEKQHRTMCNFRETAGMSTFFFNQLSVFSWLYRWNFRSPTSEGHEKNTWAYVTFLKWIKAHLQAPFSFFFFFKLLQWCNNIRLPGTQRKLNDLISSVNKRTEFYPIYWQYSLQTSPFSSVTWCREARERVQLSSLEQAGNSSSITTWFAGWNVPWASKKWKIKQKL